MNTFRKDDKGPYVYFGIIGNNVIGKLRPTTANNPMGNWNKVSFNGDKIDEDEEKLLVIATLKQPPPTTTTQAPTPQPPTNPDTPWIAIAIGAACFVVIAVVIGIILTRKCRSKNTTINEQEMTPLRSTGRPLPLAQFRQNNDPCRPTTEEFEKMENDARNKNISKSYCTAMQFVRSKTPINRYFQLNALDENANAVCVSSLLSHLPSHAGITRSCPTMRLGSI